MQYCGAAEQVMDYVIEEQLYLYPTPAGAFYAVSSPTSDQARKVLNAILGLQNTPKFTLERIRQWASISEQEEIFEESEHYNCDRAIDLVKMMQEACLIQGCQNYHSAPVGNLEDSLPDLLRSLSNDGQVLLADHLGLIISHTGFSDDVAEKFAAFSADLANLQEKHSGIISRDAGISSNAWASVDAAGNSQIGFWPLYIGSQRLVLVIAGVPRFNQEVFTQLIWALSIRYGINE